MRIVYKQIFFLMLLTCKHAYSSEQAKSQSEVIKGYLSIANDSVLYYVGNPEGTLNGNRDLKQIIDDKGEALEFKPQDVKVPIAIKDENSREIITIDYSVPTELPLSLIDTKKEGDNCSFGLKSRNNTKTIFLSLICKQLNQSHSADTFHQKLNELKGKLAVFPSHYPSDEQMLLQASIIKPNPAHNKTQPTLRPKCLHGPNGFQFISSEQNK